MKKQYIFPTIESHTLLCNNIVCVSAGKVDVSDEPAAEYTVGD